MEAFSASWDQEHLRHVFHVLWSSELLTTLERKRKLVDLLTSYLEPLLKTSDMIEFSSKLLAIWGQKSHFFDHNRVSWSICLYEVNSTDFLLPSILMNKFGLLPKSNFFFSVWWKRVSHSASRAYTIYLWRRIREVKID